MPALKNPNDVRHKASRFDLIPTGPLKRLAARYELGLKYGKGAWKNGLDLDDALNHAIDHLLTYRDRNERFLMGERPDPRLLDDDLSGATWGCMTLMAWQDGDEPGMASRGAKKGSRKSRRTSPAGTGKTGRDPR